VASARQVLRQARLVREIREMVRKAGIAPVDEDRWTLNLSPAERKLLVGPGRVLLAAGIYDDVVLPGAIAELARVWGVGVDWRPHGHISLMGSFATSRATVDYLGRQLHDPVAKGS
jgi:hypothetical protein